jgi:hypothetical protein
MLSDVARTLLSCDRRARHLASADEGGTIKAGVGAGKYLRRRSCT